MKAKSRILVRLCGDCKWGRPRASKEVRQSLFAPWDPLSTAQNGAVLLNHSDFSAEIFLIHSEPSGQCNWSQDSIPGSLSQVQPALLSVKRWSIENPL